MPLLTHRCQDHHWKWPRASFNLIIFKHDFIASVGDLVSLLSYQYLRQCCQVTENPGKKPQKLLQKNSDICPQVADKLPLKSFEMYSLFHRDTFSTKSHFVLSFLSFKLICSPSNKKTKKVKWKHFSGTRQTFSPNQ